MLKFTKNDSQGNPIHIYVYEPETTAKGVIQIIHGASEHFARYGLFAEFLAKHGYIVASCDILGHGLSTKTTEYVHFADKKGDILAFESILLVKDYIAEKYPNMKYYVLGHSMGSFLAQKLVIDYPDFYTKAIWSGTSCYCGPITSLGVALAGLIGFFKGPKYVSKLVQDISIDSISAKMRKDGIIHGLKEEWLSRDQAIVDYYHNSPICGQPFTVMANRDLFKWLNYINKPKNLRRIRKDLPILMISGGKDGLSDYGKKIAMLQKRLQNFGLLNVEMKLYPEDHHEILNELDKDVVFADIREFIEK